MGYIYLTGGYSDDTRSSVEKYHPDHPEKLDKIPYPAESSFVARWYVGNVFCKPMNSILYFGGYTFNSALVPEANYITQLNVTSSQFSTFETKGAIPAIRADHCMAINEDGSKVVVYGGVLTTGITGSIHILDTNTRVWTSGQASEARRYPSCIFVGDQVLVWGGKIAGTTSNPAEVIAVDPLLIYSVSQDAWVKSFTPYSGAGGATTTTGGGGASGVGAEKPASPTGTKTPGQESNHSAAIIGGVIGAVVVIGALVGFLLWRKRKQQRDGPGREKKKPFIIRPSTARSPNSDPDENTGLGSENYLMTAAAVTGTGGYDTPSKTSNNPQAAMEINPELEWTLRDIENQQKQLDLKRQLLALQQQEQQLRGPLPLLSVSPKVTSGAQYQQLASNPQTASAGAPVSANVPIVSAGIGGGGGVFGNKRQSGYEVHGLQYYPTPPTIKQTVHTLPESYTTHPQQQQYPYYQQQGGGASPLSNTSTVGPGSEMYQNTTEPTYGPSPVNVPNWYPGLEYQEGAIHNGVGWVRQANGPHAVVESGLGRNVSGAGISGGISSGGGGDDVQEQQQGGTVGGYHS
ncbi:hypothetical protein BGZ95_010134 [Linnemannia exigua]|uniref:Galactose oxidase n=1 Tax=Linnemannia exigua TaxID=604196 RepID=A0AAD4DBP9_9FUNG|nr:hypothetical protein BGZ95_010134 [Linnemannia exigua]